MTTLAYATPHQLYQPLSWRAWLWRHRITWCFLLALATGPWFIKWTLALAMTVFDMSGPLSWRLLLAVAAAAQGLVLLLWIAIAIGLMYDDRPLTEAEEALMPLTLIVLTCWGVADMIAAAICALV